MCQLLTSQVIMHVSMSIEIFIVNLNFYFILFCWLSMIVDITHHHACQHVHRDFICSLNFSILSNVVTFYIYVNVSIFTEILYSISTFLFYLIFIKCTEIVVVWSNQYMLTLKNGSSAAKYTQTVVDHEYDWWFNWNINNGFCWLCLYKADVLLPQQIVINTLQCHCSILCRKYGIYLKGHIHQHVYDRVTTATV